MLKAAPLEFANAVGFADRHGVQESVVAPAPRAAGAGSWAWLMGLGSSA